MQPAPRATVIGAHARFAANSERSQSLMIAQSNARPLSCFGAGAAAVGDAADALARTQPAPLRPPRSACTCAAKLSPQTA